MASPSPYRITGDRLLETLDNWDRLMNFRDVIITKVFRGTGVDMDDCIAVFQTGQVDPQKLLARYVDTESYDPNPDEKM